MASSDDKKRGRLVAYDAIAMPGRSVTLTADLVEEGVLTHPALGGEVLFFQQKDRALGRAMTGGDGRALVSVVPKKTGTEEITVRLADSRRVSAPETTAWLFVWDRRRAIVLVSLSALIPQARAEFQMPGHVLQGPEDGAIEALDALARRVNLIYLASKDSLEVQELRQWIQQYKLPSGPLIPLKPGAKWLAAQIDRWRADGWATIKGEIAATAEEAKVALGKGLKTVATPAAPQQEKWPERVVVAKDWKDVSKQFE